MNTFKMRPRHYECIEAMIAHPTASNVELAAMVGCNRNTITEWKRNPIFMEAYHKRLREIWESSEGIAINTMRNLAIDGDFKASKYILDSLGYAPVQKVEADITTDININIEE